MFAWQMDSQTPVEGWRCALLEYGEQSVTTVGMTSMLLLFVNSWDSVSQVSAECYVLDYQ